MLSKSHPFFTLPPELHTRIFTLACTPVSAREGDTGTSYLAASLTGIALALVSKYVNAASAQARRWAVVLYGWRGILAFERCLGKNDIRTGRVHYLTLICDELPSDPTSLGLLTDGFGFLSPQSSSFDRNVEKLLLKVIAKILRIVGDDLYGLEIGFQAIEHLKDPIAYLSHSTGSPLSFPHLETMFYACPPSNAFPWDRGRTLGSNGTLFARSPVASLEMPRLSCPRLRELTVICNDPSTSDIFHDETQDEALEDTVEGNELRGIQATQSNFAAEYDGHLCSGFNLPGLFPSLITLILYASTPAQAWSAFDGDETVWNVGSPIVINANSFKSRASSSPACADHERDLWPPQKLRTVVLRPKAAWNEIWESLAEVARRQREEQTEIHEKRNDDGAGSADIEILVLKRGEQLGLKSDWRTAPA